MANIVDVPGSEKRLEEKTAQAYLALVAAARAQGITAPDLEIVSGYRTHEEQQKLFAAAVAKYGSEKAARKWVAKPGHSKHETGTAIDFNLGGFKFSEADKMLTTGAYKWLQANAAHFGFEPYAPEPWHWNYTGGTIVPGVPDAATEGAGGLVAVLLILWLASGASL